ncbi:hypothetical protein BCON_0057g00340 [Botryotinia convoluta]|uniref:Tyrosine specific protein phosphatases domain-containing protein n=1 Tax=Botryotinia convoluta TaxID=54673 RepID=A0A4Z1INI2_9HELO|nr:hypothetical protein BCON_0057g00340 [Botryotinia convoluta]
MASTLHEKALEPPFITVEGIPNFRDLGGYPLALGPTSHSVRQGVVYRCGEPQRVTEKGIATMQQLGITHIYDLRSQDELIKGAAAGRGGVVEWEGCQRVFAPVFPAEDYSPEKIAIRFKDYASKGTEGFTRAYTDILNNAPNSYRTILLHLANEPSKPLIVHCTAGKDRTGVLCALILSLCGVDDEVVAREYSLTTFGLPQEWKAGIIKHLMAHPAIKDDHEGAENLISSKAENMLATLKMLREKFGGAESYVIEKCGLTIDEVERILPSRSFSLTPPQNARRATRARRSLFRWLGTQGENFRNPLDNSTNYMGAYNNDGKLKRVVEAAADARKDGVPKPDSQNEPDANGNKELPPQTARDMIPFPGNRKFISQSVLSEELRELIWTKIMQDAKSVREVSAELGVEMSRVGAVVRLKEIEKEWERAGKPLARPYADAVMSMVPVTQLNTGASRTTHESINDLPIHVATGQQIFHPTSESRHFTREDAAKIFDEKLLPADQRIPHPELIEMHKDFKAGLSRDERTARQDARDEAEEQVRQRIADRKAAEEAKIMKVNTPRWEFRIKEINVDDIGKDGRGARGTGWRYGRPLMDRKRGQVKIPTSVQ